ncbi:MAG: TVP38/TMEM64 family protein [Acidobacteria bacterium]|nr:TVP38/TMEM64 family protein [Acidobacteriota bacterium]
MPVTRRDAEGPPGTKPVTRKEPAAGRLQAGLWLVAAVALLAAGVLLTRTLPLEPALASLRTWVDSRGAVGVLAFGAAYVALVLLFVPGAVLTLIAGALFGLVRGVAIVAIASTVADAVSFLAARYVARGAVQRLAARYPRARAVDLAVARAGWRIIALLRLNPAIPYSASNYLFGATGVAFLPYLVTSGVFTLPGIVTYVYLGYAGAEAVAGRARSPAEWTLIVAGLAATVTGIIYIARLARRALVELTREAPRTGRGPT